MIDHCESFNPGTSALGGFSALDDFKKKLQQGVPSVI